MKRYWTIWPLLALLLSLSAPLAASAWAAPDFDPFWIMNHRETALWPSPARDGTPLEAVPSWRYLQVVRPQQGSWLFVADPQSDVQGFVPFEDIGPASPPPAWYVSAPPIIRHLGLPARTIGTANVRSRPFVDVATELEQLGHNSPVFVQDAVQGEDGETWYRLGPGRYIHSSVVRLPGTPAGNFPGRWIDVDLNEPAIATAYEDGQPVYSTLVIKGTKVFQTPTGTFQILRRVANETMDSATIGIPRKAKGGYYLKDVLFTQYFTDGGASIHYNYWSSNFGYSGSHGCLGMSYDDSLWFWNWADVGTTLAIHY
ncbi:MAG: L,D-transpeptidase [Chloroflexi bacterium]|nr:L,D-transpeptidase [Chloroflexota bacterium]